MQNHKVYIVILNWNSWKDTIECIESVIKSDYPNFQIIVVDNDSKDNSLEYIKKYFQRQIFPDTSNIKLRDLVTPFSENIPYIFLSEEEAIKDNAIKKGDIKISPEKLHYPVILIKNNFNYGFGKGINTALKFILNRGDAKYIWLLNNDSIVEKNTLSKLVHLAETDNMIGFVGSVIRYYHKPEIIQAIGGGKFYPILGMGKLYMKNKHISVLNNINPQEVNKYLDYLMGASLLIKNEVLKDVGLFDEDYFLYAEELDLITRGRKKGWKLAVSLDSFIYHKESASTKDKRWLYYYFINKSNMIYLKKHYGIFYNILSTPFIILNTIRVTKNFTNIKAAIKGIIDGIKYEVEYDK